MRRKVRLFWKKYKPPSELSGGNPLKRKPGYGAIGDRADGRVKIGEVWGNK